jgi:phosphopantetheine adenylyltransferase
VKINEIRLGKGMKPLDIVVTRRTSTSLLSSTYIRDNVPKPDKHDTS